MASLYPRLAPTRQRRLKQWWSKRLVQALGVRLASHGDVQTAGLLVGNHISWLDIFVINALAPSAFVSKDDVRDWPVFGWLSARADTIFLERGSRRAAHRASEHIQDCLRQGQRIALFPEGTTSDGHTVLPFHSALLQAAIDSAQPVQALALRYLDAQGQTSTAPAYVGEVTLWQCVRAIASAPQLTAQLTALAPHDTSNVDRRHLGAHLHRQISHHLGHSL